MPKAEPGLLGPKLENGRRSGMSFQNTLRGVICEAILEGVTAARAMADAPASIITIVAIHTVVAQLIIVPAFHW